MEIAEIWVYGDPAFLTAVLTGVAHVFSEDVFLYSVATGFVVNLLWSLFQWITAPQKNVLFGSLIQSIIIYAILFSPQMNVVLRTAADNGSYQISGSIPWGIAFPASALSTMGNTWREEFVDAAYTGLPATSDATLLFQNEGITPLKALLALRDHAGSARTIDEELRKSIADYFTYCIAPVLELNQTAPTNITRNTANNFSEAFKSNDYWAKLMPVDSSSSGSIVFRLPMAPYTVMSCTNAHQTIGANLQAGTMSIAADAIQKTHKWGGDEVSKTEFIDMVNDTFLAMDPASITGTANQLAENLVAFDIINGMCGDSTFLDEAYIAQCRMQSDAVHKRRLEEATKANGFLEMIVPLTTFVEGFVFLLTPLMGVMVAFFGTGAMKMLGKYAMGLAWLAIMPICQVAVDVYLAVYYNKFLGSIGQDIEFISVSFVNTQWLELESFVSFAGTAQAMIPSLAMFILFGGIHAMQGLASTASAGLKTDTGVLHGNQAIGMKDFKASAGNVDVTTGGDGSGSLMAKRTSTTGENISSQSYAIKDSVSLNQAEQKLSQETSKAAEGYAQTAVKTATYTLSNGIQLSDAEAKQMGLTKQQQIAHNEASKQIASLDKSDEVKQQIAEDVATKVYGSADGTVKPGEITEKGFKIATTMLSPFVGLEVSGKGGAGAQAQDSSSNSTANTQTKKNSTADENGRTSGDVTSSTETGSKTNQKVRTEQENETLSSLFSEQAQRASAYEQAITRQEQVQAAIANAQDSNIALSTEQMTNAMRDIGHAGAYSTAETILDGAKELALGMKEGPEGKLTEDERTILNQLGIDAEHFDETGFVKFDDSFMKGEYKEGGHDTRAISVPDYFSVETFNNNSRNALAFEGMDRGELSALNTQDHKEAFASDLLDRLMDVSNQGFKGLNGEGGKDDFIAADLLKFTGNVFQRLGENDYGPQATGGTNGEHQGMINWGKAQVELSETLRAVDPESTLKPVDVSDVKEGKVLSKDDAAQLNSNKVAMAASATDELEKKTFESVEDKDFFNDYVRSLVGSNEFESLLSQGLINLNKDENGNVVGFDVGNLAAKYANAEGRFDKESFEAQFEERRAQVVDDINFGVSWAVTRAFGHNTKLFDPNDTSIKDHVNLLRDDATWDKAAQLTALERQSEDIYKEVRGDYMQSSTAMLPMSHFGGIVNMTEQYTKKAEEFDALAEKAVQTGDYGEFRSSLKEIGIESDKVESIIDRTKALDEFTNENSEIVDTLVIAQALSEDGVNSDTGDLETAVKQKKMELYADQSALGKVFFQANEFFDG